MKTFYEIHQQIFNEICKSPDGWPENMSMAELSELAAKEYAKQWVKEANQTESDSYVEYYLKQIDAQ